MKTQGRTNQGHHFNFFVVKKSLFCIFLMLPSVSKITPVNIKNFQKPCFNLNVYVFGYIVIVQNLKGLYIYYKLRYLYSRFEKQHLEETDLKTKVQLKNEITLEMNTIIFLPILWKFWINLFDKITLRIFKKTPSKFTN